MQQRAVLQMTLTDVMVLCSRDMGPGGSVEYVCVCTRLSGYQWVSAKRYSEFSEFRDGIKKVHRGAEIRDAAGAEVLQVSFPRKTLTRKGGPKAVEKRRIQLGEWVNEMLNKGSPGLIDALENFLYQGKFGPSELSTLARGWPELGNLAETSTLE